MGGTTWSDDHYARRAARRAAAGEDTFAYTSRVRSGKVAARTHEALDPSKMKAAGREARDSDEHPNSNPVYIGLDVTGSMHTVPEIVQSRLKELMALLLTKGYLEDPAVCVSAIGDAGYDAAPFQVGQFESGIEIEDDLTRLYLEGGGGGNAHESYDLALYFLARKVRTDAWEKRKRRGYAFIICDENLPKTCRRKHIRKVFGDKVPADIPTADLLAEVQEKWELYCIVPNMTAHYRTGYQDSWKDAIGQRVLFLDDPEAVSETIASVIGVVEGETDLSALVGDLTEDAGLSADSAEAVTRALVKVAEGAGALSQVTDATGLTSL